MKRILSLFLLASLAATSVFADEDPDWDPAKNKAQAAAARQAAKERNAALKQQWAEQSARSKAAAKEKTAMKMEARRKAVGAAAEGKSDAEVTRMYVRLVRQDPSKKVP